MERRTVIIWLHTLAIVGLAVLVGALLARLLMLEQTLDLQGRNADKDRGLVERLEKRLAKLQLEQDAARADPTAMAVPPDEATSARMINEAEWLPPGVR